MNNLDRILDNQAIIMRVLMEMLARLPSHDPGHHQRVIQMLADASSDTYEYAHRSDEGSIRP